MGPHFIPLVVYFHALSGTNAETQYVAVPGSAGKYRLVSADFVPATSLPADASNNAVLTLKKGVGGTTIGTLTTDSDTTGFVSLTAGTKAPITLATGTMRDFNAATATESVECAVTKGGTGGAFEGNLVLLFERSENP